jgi:cellulose synthase/poly-beta-1,6-N-acetylglucosamine synthase-like glycosyltransferase
MNKISIIIPVWNEAKNVRTLVKQIDDALRSHSIGYEIIFIDDHSTDSTKSVVKALESTYAIRLFEKIGSKGKAYSLLQGFKHAKYDLICMLDADLQYSPKFIPEMMEKIENGADIVVGNRRKYAAGLHRKIISKTFNFLFVRMLHGFKVDSQAGLKVFRKVVVDHLELNPSSWTFDLELLIKARNAGYKIENHDITFSKRYAGSSKIAFVKSSYEIGKNAVKLKMSDRGLVPFSKQQAKEKGQGFFVRGNEFVHHTNLEVKESAFSRMTRIQHLGLATLISFIIAALIWNWHLALIAMITILTLIYFSDLLFNFFLIYRSFFREPELDVKEHEYANIKDREWPTYTVLCPLYKEWQVLPQFTKAMSALEYPKNKLQVMLLIEEDDTESIEKLDIMKLPSYFDVIIVPNSFPKTKPKACNYGLLHAKGEYTVIYDAEDVPDPLQLKKSVLAFRKANKNVVCIQAKLNFYNPNQNILTRMFTIEYSLWFNLVLSGLMSIHAPIPLGGTSNHFRTKDLQLLEKWDPFNVTEDADLGMRIIKRGYRTALMNSTTMEEANSHFGNWIKQRSRWTKGYIQTYFVHMRKPKEFFPTWYSPHFVIFQLVIGAKILSMLVNPLMWGMTIAYFGFGYYTADFIQSLYLTPIFYMAVFSMFIGNFLYMYYYMLGAAKRNQWDLIPFAMLTPIYWLAMSAAAGLALWEFIFKPHYWHKTQHGLHLSGTEDALFVVDKTPQIAALHV